MLSKTFLYYYATFQMDQLCKIMQITFDFLWLERTFFFLIRFGAASVVRRADHPALGLDICPHKRAQGSHKSTSAQDLNLVNQPLLSKHQREGRVCLFFSVKCLSCSTHGSDSFQFQQKENNGEEKGREQGNQVIVHYVFSKGHTNISTWSNWMKKNSEI